MQIWKSLPGIASLRQLGAENRSHSAGGRESHISAPSFGGTPPPSDQGTIVHICQTHRRMGAGFTGT